MPHATVPSPGLQALILCGPGESLGTFTSNPSDFSKALIPIANRPMVWYPLDWCYRMGVNDITLITPPESKNALEAALATNPALTSLPNPKPEILAPEHLTQTSGTGDLLRLEQVQKIITSDFVVLPCDLISEVDGSRLVQQWVTLNPLSISTRGSKKRKGGLAVFYPTQGREGISQKKDETDFIASVPLSTASVPPPAGSLRSDIETLVMSIPTDTLKDKLEEDKGVLRLRGALSRTYGRVKLKTKHRDAHVYILPKWVKDFAARNDKFDSISEDVMGWWAKAQWQKGLGEKLGLADVLLGHDATTEDDMMGSGRLGDDEEDHDTVDAAALSSTQIYSPDQPTPNTATTFASRVRSVAAPMAPAIPPLLAYVQPSPSSAQQQQPLIRRVDTSSALLSVSLYLAKQAAGGPHSLSHADKVHPTAKIGLQSRVMQEDSLVAENVTIGTRSIVKESVVGPNCDIGNNVRLTRCLLMDGVTVGDGVQLTGCIVGRRARLEGMKPAPPAAAPGEAEAAAAGIDAPAAPAAEAGGKKKGKKSAAASAGDEDDRTRLTDCEIAPLFTVEAGTEAKGEKMMAFDTEGFEDDEDDDEDDDDNEDDDDDHDEEEEDEESEEGD